MFYIISKKYALTYFLIRLLQLLFSILNTFVDSCLRKYAKIIFIPVYLKKAETFSKKWVKTIRKARLKIVIFPPLNTSNRLKIM